jgi:hypothetical protein
MTSMDNNFGCVQNDRTKFLEKMKQCQYFHQTLQAK